ncbi:MAG: hypothetical protein V7K92_10690 [Nostoc sp.]|uniref:hypothetical protein n=1 Tax=Nostoc sp. TaxID=1180 RepID=UPI002FF2A26F
MRDRFLNHFYFGTESYNSRVSPAFNRAANPFGDVCGGQRQRLKAFLGSDSGDWDVPDITTVTANAYSMAEHEIIQEFPLQICGHSPLWKMV